MQIPYERAAPGLTVESQPSLSAAGIETRQSAAVRRNGVAEGKRNAGRVEEGWRAESTACRERARGSERDAARKRGSRRKKREDEKEGKAGVRAAEREAERIPAQPVCASASESD